MLMTAGSGESIVSGARDALKQTVTAATAIDRSRKWYQQLMVAAGYDGN